MNNTSFISLILMFCITIVVTSSSETSNTFCCDNGVCISHYSRCDYKNDCEDASDEKDCPIPPCDESRNFRCANNRCVPMRWKCDGSDDCYDNSDEDEVMCKNHTCPPEHYNCANTRNCILNSWKCDGDIDCDERDDEQNCPKVKCSDDEFRCANGVECVEKPFQCDGEDDCMDGSDETDCSIVCADNMFKCTKHPQCILYSWKCDGTSDCEDESDEQNCTKTTHKCPNKYFACLGGAISCIPHRWKCDGNPECSDKSDERNCDNIISRCSFGEFHCHNMRQCIPKEKRCDGARDCVDSSDEVDCPGVDPRKSKCPATTHYRCPGPGEVCIPNHQFCDTHAQCPGGEDEKQGPHFCNYDECSESNGNCSHICTDLRVGYQCSCPPGYKLGSDGKICDDIDECKSAYPPCTQVCVNELGSYKCECWPGFQREHLGESLEACKPVNDTYDISLIITDKDKIKKINKHSKHLQQTLIHDITVSSVSLDITNDFVYYADPRLETISRFKLSEQSETPEIILQGDVLSVPHALAVDWVNGHLYWADREFNTLSVSYLNGSLPRTLLTLRNSIVIATAVHPMQGYIFICIMDDSIKRCGLDGKDCLNIVNATMAQFISVDLAHDMIYWTDVMLQTIQASDLDGNNARVLRYMENFQPYSLAVFSGNVYWSDTQQRNIFVTNSTGGDLKVFAKNVHHLAMIHVLHPLAQPQGQSVCLDSPCKYLCLPRANGSEPAYACVCPDQYIPVDDDSIDCMHKKTTTPPTTKSSNRIMIKTTTTNQRAEQAPVTATNQGMSSGTEVMVAVVIIAIIILIVAIGCFGVRWHKRRNERRSMNFNNPIYRKVVSQNSVNDERSMGSRGSLNVAPTAGLILNEERPGASRQEGEVFSSSRREGYAEIESDDFEIDYTGSTERLT